MRKITPIPTPPSTNDSATFDLRADAFLASLPQLADELNAFADEVVEDTTQKAADIASGVENKLVGQIDKKVSDLQDNVKTSILREVAIETSALTRPSFRLLNLNFSPRLDLVPYQEVLRQNSENDKESIVHYGDIFVPEIIGTLQNGYEKTALSRLSLPRTLREVKAHKNDIKYNANAEVVSLKSGEESLVDDYIMYFSYDNVWVDWVSVPNGTARYEVERLGGSERLARFKAYFTPNVSVKTTVTLKFNLRSQQSGYSQTIYRSFTLVLYPQNMEKIEVQAGHRHTKTLSGVAINSLSVSAQLGICSYEISEDKQSAKVHYDAPLSDTVLSDEVTLSVNGASQQFFAQISPIEDEHQNRLDTPLSYKHIAGCDYRVLVAPEPLGNFIFYFAKSLLNHGSAINGFNTTEYKTPLKFTFPAKVKKFICDTALFKTFVAARNHSNFILLEDGSLWVQGENTSAQLGIGNQVNTVYFLKNPYVSELKDIFYFPQQSAYVFAISKDNKLYYWGGTTLKPTQIEYEFDSEIVNVFASTNAHYVLLESGTLLTLNTSNFTLSEAAVQNIKSVSSNGYFFLSKDKLLYAIDSTRFKDENNQSISTPCYAEIDKVKELKKTYLKNASISATVLMREEENDTLYCNFASDIHFVNRYLKSPAVTGHFSSFYPVRFGAKILDYEAKEGYTMSQSASNITVALVLQGKDKDALYHATGAIFEKFR